MYIQISFDGKVVSTSGNANKHIAGQVYLDSNNNLVFQTNNYGSIKYYEGAFANDFDRGKIKEIDDEFFSYYNYSDASYEVGKIKKIGSIYIYYNSDGSLKSIG